MEPANKLQCKCLSIDSYCFSEEFVKLYSAFYVSLDELLIREGAMGDSTSEKTTSLSE